jgi:hypothetical protein
VAAAQDDGVFFDPGGPSEKEYAVPHEQARGGGDAPSSGDGGGSGGAAPGGGSEAQGDGGDGGSGTDDSAESPLFGAGIPRSTGDRDDDGRAGARGRSGGDTDRAVAASSAATETNSATGLGWLALIAVGVALTGGGLAYLVRRKSRGPTS